MSWILLCIWLFSLIFILAKLPIVKKSRLKFQFILLVFLVKIVAGFGLTLLYTNYYSDRGSADIYKFYDDAVVIASALPENPVHYFKLITGFYEDDLELKSYTDSMRNWMPQSVEWLEFTQTQNYNIFQSNRIITRINALLIPITAGNIYSIVIIFCWISLLGLLVIIELFKETESALSYWIFLFFPSLLLWCSAPMKDTLTLLSVCVLFYYSARIENNKNSIASILWILMSLLILLLTKYYVAIAFIPAFLIYLIQYNWYRFKPHKKVFVAVLGVCLLFALIFILPKLIDVLNGKREEALKAALFGEAKHLLFIDLIDGGIAGFLIEIPKAIYTTIFRPMIWETSDSILVLVSSVENIILLILVVYTSLKNGRNILRSPSFYPMAAFILTLASIIGYTTPVAGGVMRYKTALLLPLLFLCVQDLTSNKKPNLLNEFLNRFTFKTTNYPNSNKRIA